MRINLCQLSTEWFEWKKGKISSSMIGSIMNVSPWKSKRKLWQEMLGIISPPEQNHHMSRGVALEPMVRKMAESELLCTFEPACFQSDENPLFIASLDGITEDGKTIIEIKCSLKHKDEIPEHYRMQMNWAMWISGAEQCFYCVFAEEKLDIRIVFRDESLIRAMGREALLFLDQLRNLEEPEPEDSDCEELHDEEAIRLQIEYEELDREAKSFAARRDLVRAKLIELANGRNLLIGNLVISKTRKPGAIQYDKIEALKGIDLEFYRKPPTDFYRITRKK